MQTYEPNHEIFSAVITFVRATRADDRLQAGTLMQRERRKIIKQIADDVAKLHDVNADELIKVTARQMSGRLN